MVDRAGVGSGREKLQQRHKGRKAGVGCAALVERGVDRVVERERTKILELGVCFGFDEHALLAEARLQERGVNLLQTDENTKQNLRVCEYTRQFYKKK
jgi:hypothetical protein